MEKQWYVIHAYSGYETKVREALIERIERLGMSDLFGEIMVPSEEVVEMRGGCIQAAAHLYSAVSPVLRMHGMDTRQLDRTLKAGYDHYESYAQNARDGVQVMDSVAAHLRGGYSYR